MPKLSTVDVAEMGAMMLQREEQRMRERDEEERREIKVILRIALSSPKRALVVAHTEQQFRRFRNRLFQAFYIVRRDVQERDCVRVFRAEHLCGLDPKGVHLVLLNSWQETAHPDLHHGVRWFMDRGGEPLTT